MLISHAASFEDVVLWRALGDVPDGRYIEVGASGPGAPSATRLFHERGWRGLLLPQSPDALASLSEERAGDTILSPPEGGPDVAEAMGRTLAESFEPPVHFLKLNHAGAEEPVLRALDLSVHRPWVLVVTDKDSAEGGDRRAWEGLVLAAGYRFCLFDGINRFYLAREHSALFGRLAVPANANDGFKIAPGSTFALESSEAATQSSTDAADGVYARHTEVEATVARLEQVEAELRAALRAARTETANIEQQRLELSVALEVVERRSAEAQRSAALGIDAQTASERRARRLAGELGDTLAEVGTVRGRLAETEGRLDVLRERCAEAEAGLAAARDRQSVSEGQFAVLHKHNAEAEEAISKAREGLSAMQSRLAQQTAHAEDAWAQAEASDRKLRDTESRATGAEARVSEAEARAVGAEAWAADRDARVAETEARAAHTEQRARALEQRMTTLGEEADRARRQIDRLQSETGTSRTAARQSDQAAAELTADLQRVRAELDQHRRELARVQEDRELVRQDLRRHRETLEAMRSSTAWRLTAPIRSATITARRAPRAALRGVIATRILTLPSWLLRKLSPGLWRRVAGPLAARAGVGMPPPPTPAPEPPRLGPPAQRAETLTQQPPAGAVTGRVDELSSLIDSYRRERSVEPAR